MCSFCIFFPGGNNGVVLSVRVSVMSDFIADGDGWLYPNRICRLGCRFGVRSVGSIGVLRIFYGCQFVEFQVIVIYYFFWYSLGVSWIFLFVAIHVFIMTLIIVGDCSYML